MLTMRDKEQRIREYKKQWSTVIARRETLKKFVVDNGPMLFLFKKK